MSLTVRTAEAAATADSSCSVRNPGDAVVATFASLMSAFEVPLHQLRNGATIERAGRILATFFAHDEKSGQWRVWVFGGLQ